MKILHVVDSLDPAGGGPPVVMTRLAAAQAALGHDVTLAAFGPLAVDRLSGLLSGVPNAERLRLRWVTPVGRLSAALGLGLRRELQDVVESSDVVHTHGVWDVLIRAACQLAYRRGVPYVVAPHGMLDPWSLAQRATKKRIALALGYRRLLQRATFLHVLNQDEADLIAPLRLRTPIEVIPNGVFMEEMEPLPSSEEFRAQHPELAGDPYILFLGRLHHKKGLDYLADAFAIAAARAPELRLVVAGPEAGAGDDFLRRVREHGIASRVHLVGPVYGPQKYAALAGADCFCLPSRQEGFSIAVLEALACGVPAVLSEACHFPQVEEAGAGRIVALDPQAIGAALVEVSRGGNAMRARARSLVQSQFLWANIAQKVLGLYTRLSQAGLPRTAATPTLQPPLQAS
jgi:glycosyltransferase involved in cell wall biosynthesis